MSAVFDRYRPKNLCEFTTLLILFFFFLNHAVHLQFILYDQCLSPRWNCFYSSIISPLFFFLNIRFLYILFFHDVLLLINVLLGQEEKAPLPWNKFIVMEGNTVNLTLTQCDGRESPPVHLHLHQPGARFI